MELSPTPLPALPELGREDTYYGKLAHKAEKAGDLHTRAANKVAQYLTLARKKPEWPEKLKYLQYAIEKHAKPQPPIDDAVWAFYQGLQEWIRQEAGAQALVLAAKEDEFYTERTRQSEARFRIVSDAARFFRVLLGVTGDRPDWFTEGDYQQLRKLQLKWA